MYFILQGSLPKISKSSPVYLDEGAERHDGGRPHLGGWIREQSLELVGRVVPGGRAARLLVPVPARRQADHQPLPGLEMSTEFREIFTIFREDPYYV